MLELGGAFRNFMESLFGFLSEFLSQLFTWLSNLFTGLHIDLS